MFCMNTANFGKVSKLTESCCIDGSIFLQLLTKMKSLVPKSITIFEGEGEKENRSIEKEGLHKEENLLYLSFLITD